MIWGIQGEKPFQLDCSLMAVEIKHTVSCLRPQKNFRLDPANETRQANVDLEALRCMLKKCGNPSRKIKLTCTV